MEKKNNILIYIIVSCEHGYDSHPQSQINSGKPIKTNFKTDSKKQAEDKVFHGDRISHSRDPHQEK